MEVFWRFTEQECRSAASKLSIIGGGGRVGRYYGLWLKENGLEQAVAMTHGSVTGIIAAVRSGVGCAALPCMVAELDPELVRCLPATTNGGMEIWLLTHERQRHSPRIRTVLDFLANRLKRHAVAVEGAVVQAAAPPIRNRIAAKP